MTNRLCPITADDSGIGDAVHDRPDREERDVIHRSAKARKGWTYTALGLAHVSNVWAEGHSPIVGAATGCRPIVPR
jgi:hypothetical protein